MVRYACSLALVTALSGCMTPLAVEAIEDAGRQGRSPPVHETLEVTRLERAVRGGDGIYTIETTYSGGERRCFTYDPSPAVRVSHPLRGWPETGRGKFEACGEYASFPAGTPICVRGIDCGPEGHCLRAREGWLELREGSGAFERVASFPRPSIMRLGERHYASYLKQILYAGVVLPLAVAGDLTLGAAILFVRMGGLSALAQGCH